MTTYLYLIRCFFSLFFIASPLNPYISGFTFYLWGVLALLDFQFLKRLRDFNVLIVLNMILWVVLAFVFDGAAMAARIIFIHIGVSYIIKMEKEVINKIFFFFSISCIWCIVQFISYHVNPTISLMLGPTQMSKLIWGEFATPTYTNQFAIFLWPRMSGLSREAGFFASLLVAIFVIKFYQKKKIGLSNLIIYFFAYIFSLSKSSIQIFLLFILYPIRNYINKIPAPITLSLLMVATIGIASVLNVGSQNYFLNNESMAHRLSSSYLVTQMDGMSLVIGCDDEYKCVDKDAIPIVSFLQSRNLEPMTGINGTIVKFGFLGYIALLLSVFLLKLKSFDVIFLFVMVITTSLFTLDNFIVLSYYFILYGKSFSLRQLKQ